MIILMRALGGSTMTTLGRSLVFVTLLLAGCATHSTRYTWTGDAAQLPQVNQACARDMQKSYIPRIAAARTDFRGKIVGGVVPTLYKDCVRGYGYVQVNEAELGPDVTYSYEVTDGVGYQRYRLEACGSPDQTCLWVVPSGFGIAPLPSNTQP